jgi:hypothetical protein
MPEQIKVAADSLGLTEKEFFDKYLMIDWYENHQKSDNEIFVLAPAIENEDPGGMYPGDPRGQCTLYNSKKLCDIHTVKPFECSELECGEQDVQKRHDSVAEAWICHQDYIEKLLGEKPYAIEFHGGGLFDILGL